jgi:hypothetical protein
MRCRRMRIRHEVEFSQILFIQTHRSGPMAAKPPNIVQCPGCEEMYDASDPAQVQAHAPHLEI